MADSSTDPSANTGSANTVVIPVLEGQTCIGELLPDFKDIVGMSSAEGVLTAAGESADGQQMLF
ncbi:hypothetical protein [Arthrobacter sp. B10-11]|uniref:hypothetical protein n=1 Tax=Arthrobacter sp. B10-11 TaxID=3081160 RepID=UPI0029531950|nr:hypothetical protein [Arthrobacter sp. B10-11]MDV8147823.1 hypothetical protein [Arthrobacter sp. B10-11]